MVRRNTVCLSYKSDCGLVWSPSAVSSRTWAVPSLLLLLTQQVYRPHCVEFLSLGSVAFSFMVNAAISPSCRWSVDFSVTSSDLNFSPILSSVLWDAVRWEKLWKQRCWYQFWSKSRHHIIYRFHIHCMKTLAQLLYAHLCLVCVCSLPRMLKRNGLAISSSLPNGLITGSYFSWLSWIIDMMAYYCKPAVKLTSPFIHFHHTLYPLF